MGKGADFDHPTHVVTLFDYDANKDDLVTSSGEHNFVAPDVNVVLSFKRGETFCVLSKVLDWWILCRSLTSGKEGYIATVHCAPVNLNDAGEDTNDKCSYVNNDCVFNLMYFPNTPPTTVRNKRSPEESANIFSLATFWWITNLIVTGYKRPIEDGDLWNLSEASKANLLREKFEEAWRKELEKTNSSRIKRSMDVGDNENQPNIENVPVKNKYKPSVTKALTEVFWFEFFLGTIMKVIHDVLQFCAPVLLEKLIDFVQSGNPDGKWGYIYALLLFVTVSLQSLFLAHYFNKTFLVGMNVRSALTASVYKKMLRFNSNGRRNFTAGEMVNIMSVDIQKIQDLINFLNSAWSSPLQIIVSIGLLYVHVGYSVFVGLGVLLTFSILNTCLSGKLKSLQTRQMKEKDLRVKLMNEVLNGIRVIKLYAWEESFIEKLMGYRTIELKKLARGAGVTQLLGLIMKVAPIISIIATFAVYIYVGNELTAVKAFVTISLFNIMEFPMIFIPILVSNLMNANVAMKRISKYLKGDELCETDVTRTEDTTTECDHVIQIKDGTFTWENIESPVLKDINLQIPRGSLTAIVGQVGCGKSSLLHALLGEIQKVSGEVMFHGSTAYVAQLPWIQNRSLKDNILFDEKFHKGKYDDIVRACALKADIDILPNGDETEIGEKGINLSGGQKQRVAIARAVYNNANVYLFDDPLSAVDAHVGNHIFQHVLSHQGLLKHKTRVFVTHNLSYLRSVDKIIVLKDNRIAELGSFEELSKGSGDFSEFLETYLSKQENNMDNMDTHHSFDKSEEGETERDINGSLKAEDCDVKIPAVDDIENVDIVDGLEESDSELENFDVGFVNAGVENEIVDYNRRASSVSKYSLKKTSHVHNDKLQAILEKADNENLNEEVKVEGLIKEETTETGRIKPSIFFVYIKAVGIFVFSTLVLLQVSDKVILVGSRFWLADWSSTSNLTSSQRDFYIGIYAAFGGAEFIALLLSLYCALIGRVSASRILHGKLLHSILRCPMRFFDTTPIGRIVNRFSKDIDVLDEQIPRSLDFVIRTLAQSLCSIFAIAYSTPIFLAVFFPITLIFYFAQRVYVASSRQLRRIESVRRSPIFNHFMESINGATTIRAFGKSQKFLQDNEQKVDYNQMAYFPWFIANRWLSMRLEFCGSLITFFAALFAIEQRNNISAGIAGLSISYSLIVTSNLMWLVRQTSELEVNIVAVERIKNYMESPSEAPRVIKENQSDADWPSSGIVEFKNYSTRYRDGLDLVLKDISFSSIKSEKIGIVGRTGAGKSSIALALFRLIEPVNGSIYIDGVDIVTLGLKDLRSKLSIIPQDPVLFSSTIRFNLDPMDSISDHDIWAALEVANLKMFVEGLDDGLEHIVEEGGQNLSVGQRQLICLARAVLRKSKVLILDEATAAVDMETDAMIQRTIKMEFKNCTILTIAHRLNTIMDYDRIMVLDQGEIAEFDTPDNLLLRTDSKFYNMAKDAGILGLS